MAGRTRWLGFLLGLTVSHHAGAQTPPESFGTSAPTFVRLLGAFDFTSIHSTSVWEVEGVIRRYGDGSTAAMRLPDGALLESIEFDYCDTDATPNANLQFDVGRCDRYGKNCVLLMPTMFSEGAEGCVSRAISGLSVPIDNVNYAYVLAVGGAFDLGRQFAGALVGYRLRVSPAPTVSTFGDVPTDHLFFQFVEALVRSGITAGCGGGNFCPDAPLTRGQMAVFLAKALGLQWP